MDSTIYLSPLKIIRLKKPELGAVFCGVSRIEIFGSQKFEIKQKIFERRKLRY